MRPQRCYQQYTLLNVVFWQWSALQKRCLELSLTHCPTWFSRDSDTADRRGHFFQPESVLGLPFTVWLLLSGHLCLFLCSIVKCGSCLLLYSMPPSYPLSLSKCANPHGDRNHVLVHNSHIHKPNPDSSCEVHPCRCLPGISTGIYQKHKELNTPLPAILPSSHSRSHIQLFVPETHPPRPFYKHSTFITRTERDLQGSLKSISFSAPYSSHASANPHPILTCSSTSASACTVGPFQPLCEQPAVIF